jgi:hypothetical protein
MAIMKWAALLALSTLCACSTSLSPGDRRSLDGQAYANCLQLPKGCSDFRGMR